MTTIYAKNKINIIFTFKGKNIKFILNSFNQIRKYEPYIYTINKMCRSEFVQERMGFLIKANVYLWARTNPVILFLIIFFLSSIWSMAHHPNHWEL
jgi:hypothetical protein